MHKFITRFNRLNTSAQAGSRGLWQTLAQINLPKHHSFLRLLVGAIALVGSAMANASEFYRADSVSMRIGITKLQPAPSVDAFYCEYGVCATVTLKYSVETVLCENRGTQVPACFMSPE